MAWVHIPVPSSTWQNPETPGCCSSEHVEDMGGTSLLILSKHCQGSLPTFLHSLEALWLPQSTCLPHAQALVPYWAASKLSSTEPVGGDGSSPSSPLLLPSSGSQGDTFPVGGDSPSVWALVCGYKVLSSVSHPGWFLVTANKKWSRLKEIKENQ